MAEFLALPQLRLLMLCSAILGLNMLLLAIGTVLARGRSKRFINPEDAKVSSKEARVLEGEEAELPGRFVRAHRNAVENIPLFFAIGLFYVMTGGSVLGARAYFLTFTIARLLHSVVYLKGIQPWRTILFVVGYVALLGMIVHIIRASI